jgi:hypothetical protein
MFPTISLLLTHRVVGAWEVSLVGSISPNLGLKWLLALSNQPVIFQIWLMRPALGTLIISSFLPCFGH